MHARPMIVPLSFVVLALSVSCSACVSRPTGAAQPGPSPLQVIASRSPGAPETPLSGTVSIAKTDRKPGQPLTLRGRIVIVGSEPHTRAIIRGEDGQASWDISPFDAGRQLWDKQGFLLEISGTLLEDGSVQPLSWKIVN